MDGYGDGTEDGGRVRFRDASWEGGGATGERRGGAGAGAGAGAVGRKEGRSCFVVTGKVGEKCLTEVVNGFVPGRLRWRCTVDDITLWSRYDLYA